MLIKINKLVIRKYLPTDRENCRSLWKELTEWHRQIYQDPNIGGSSPENDFDKHLAKVGANNLWVGILDSKVIGLTGLIVNEKEAEMEPLIISQHYRNKGVGKKLVEKVVAEARNLDIRYLSVKPVARNEQALKFFYKQGFKNIGHVELFIDFKKQQLKKGLNLFKLQFNY